MLHIEPLRSSWPAASSSSHPHDVLSLLITCRVETKLPLYVRSLGKGGFRDNKATDGCSLPPSEVNSRSVSPALQEESAAGEELVETISVTFQRSVKEFRHMLEGLRDVIPSIPLPRWPINRDDKTFLMLDLPQLAAVTDEYLVAWTAATLRYLTVVEEVVSSEWFMTFLDTTVVATSHFTSLRVKPKEKRVADALALYADNSYRTGSDVPALFVFDQLSAADRALQPFAAALRTADVQQATSATAAASAPLAKEAHQLRQLSSSLMALLAEMMTLRNKLVKDVSERLSRKRQGSGLFSVFGRDRGSVADFSCLIASKGLQLHDRELIDGFRLGDKVCGAGSGGSSWVGTVVSAMQQPGVASVHSSSNLSRRAAAPASLVAVMWDALSVHDGGQDHSKQQPPGDSVHVYHQSTAGSSSAPFCMEGLLHNSGSFVNDVYHHMPSADGDRRHGQFGQLVTVCKASQLLPDPCANDPTIASILQSCIAIDRALVPQERSSHHVLLTRSAATILALWSCQTNFISSMSAWITKLLACQKTVLLATYWVQLTESQSAAGASAARDETGASLLDRKRLAVDLLQQQRLTLQRCIVDFFSVWACYAAARKMNDMSLAAEFTQMAWHFEHVPVGGGFAHSSRNDDDVCVAVEPESSCTALDELFELDAEYEFYGLV